MPHFEKVHVLVSLALIARDYNPAHPVLFTTEDTECTEEEALGFTLSVYSVPSVVG